MGTIREFTGGDPSSIWTLLNHIRDETNPQIYDSGVWNLATPTGTLNGGTAAFNGSALLRRVGNLVTLSLLVYITSGGVFAGANVNGTNVLTIPAGARPPGAGYNPWLGRVRCTNPSTLADVVYNPGAHRLALEGGTGTWSGGSGFMAAELVWGTREAIPSSWPGTQV